MAEENTDRADEYEAELEAEINAELERIGQDPDRVDEGSDQLGTQNAPSGEPREETASEEGDASPADEDESK